MPSFFQRANNIPLTEAALVSEMNLMRRVFDSVSNGVSISDATADDLPLIYVNPAFEKMTGYSSAETLGRNCRFLQRGETPQAELAQIREALNRQEDLRIVLKNYTKAGETFWNELYLSPVFDSENQLTHYVGIQNDITVRVELTRRMEYMALHDSLTDLANRPMAMDRIQESLDRARRTGRMVAVLFIDLDGFKEINDRYGHESGDELLRAVAARLRLSLRASDCAARLGGDEFVVVAPDLSEVSEVDEITARIMSRMEQPLALGAAVIVPRASVGVGIYPRDADSPQGLLKAADLAMYLDKRLRNERGLFRRSDDAAL